MDKQAGLEWVGETFGLEPRWTAEPDIASIESLARAHLKIEGKAACHATFYAQGAFNKLYQIEVDGGSSLMRVTLPVDPSHKTNSEVATIRFVAQNTDIPVPQIFGFDDSGENELGFEWILMEKLPGAALRTRWRKLSEGAKRELVKQVAKFQAQLFRHKFSTIGNLFTKEGTRAASNAGPHPPVLPDQTPEEGVPLSSHALGPLVSMAFFWGDHINYDVPRGPFTSSEDWLRVRLAFVLSDQEKVIETSTDEDDLEEAGEIKTLAKRLLDLLPSVFSPQADTAEPSTLFHDDLSMQNILVGEDGKVTGVIDWECVSALPLWRACRVPEFLTGAHRVERPERDSYAPDEADETTVQNSNRPSETLLDNEGINSLYWEHLLEYELTNLRELFHKEMETLAPGWTELLEKSTFQADFEEAVQGCDSGWTTRTVKSWVDALEKGEKWSLRSKLHG